MKNIFGVIVIMASTAILAEQAPLAPKFNFNACLIGPETKEIPEPHYQCTDLQNTRALPKASIARRLNKYPECLKALQDINHYIGRPEFLKFAKDNSLKLNHVSASVFINDKVARAQNVKIQDTFVVGVLDGTNETSLGLTGENMIIMEKPHSRFIGHLNIDDNVSNPSKGSCKVVISTDPADGHGQASVSTEIDLNHPVKSMQGWLDGLDRGEKQKISNLVNLAKPFIYQNAYGQPSKESPFIERGFTPSAQR